MKQPPTAALSTGPSSIATADNVKSDSPRPVRKIAHIPESILSGLAQVREDLYRVEDQQMTFIDQLEVKSLQLLLLLCESMETLERLRVLSIDPIPE